MSAPTRDIAFIFLAWLIFMAVPATGEEAAKGAGRKVTASASATLMVKPDSARLTFAVATTDMNGKSAREENEKKIKKVKEALAALGFKKTEVEVHVLPSSLNTLITPARPNAPGGRALQGKRARSTFYVTVRQKDLEKLREAVGKLAETATDNGATGVDTDDIRSVVIRRGFRAGMDDPEALGSPAIEWLVADTAAARREAIKQAVADAMADAQAAVGNAKLKVVEINVSASRDQRTRVTYRQLTGETESGLIPIRVEVQVTCSY
jgi:uncharacterized protein YggE